MIDPRANSAGGVSTVTPGVRLYSGKIVDVDPSVISVPPCRTNWYRFINPSKPMPPRMSLVESGVPNDGVSAVRRYGTGWVPVTGTPATADWALPPTCG